MNAYINRLIIIFFSLISSDKKKNLEELNQLISQGWKVVNQSAMGGGGGFNSVFSLVILEQ
jgi:hypothetical protein